MSTHPFASQPTPAGADAPITAFADEHRFLSNFWFVPGGVRLGDLTGPTVEHVFQAAKTLDPAQRAAVLAAEKPGPAKRLGGRVTLRPDWERVKLGVMARLQASKYAQPDLAQQLLATGDALLVEGNRWCDTFWGVCSCPAHNDQGQNWLGQILMIHRSVLRGANGI